MNSVLFIYFDHLSPKTLAFKILKGPIIQNPKEVFSLILIQKLILDFNNVNQKI